MAKTSSGYSHSIRVEALWMPQENKRPANLMGVEPWVIRNLLNYKNCCVKETYFHKVEGMLLKLFGKIGFKPIDKGCCIIEVTPEAVAKAKLLIY